MRTVLATTLLAFTLGGAAAPSLANACDKASKKGVISAKSERKATKTATANFHVKLKCSDCGNKVKKALMSNEAILAVTIQVEDNRVTVEYDSDKLDPTKIASLIKEKTSYAASPEA